MPKRETPDDGEPQKVTYERWFAIAVGQMRIAPDVFAAMTPAEFVYAWLGWAEHEQRRERQAWERGRWAVWVAACIQLEKKDRLPMAEMFPLPWEQTRPALREPTMEERRVRIEAMKRCIRQRP